ncbi:MAG: RNA-binding protein [Xanthobacteraceae bacterium]
MTASPQQAELDSGPQSRERERMCVLTREVRPVADLIRFVVGPDGAAVPDLKSKLPGRGVWVTATRDALAEAVKRKALVRGFKREVRLNADLVTQTGQLLEQAALDALAMAGKAGLVANGFGKTEAALADEDKRVIGLIHATDAAPDGVRKLGAALRRRDSGDQVAVITSLTTAQLDLALGRPNVVHAAVLAGSASHTFLARLRRLERFRSGEQSV